MRILVTGAGGYIGTEVACRLTAHRCTVVAAARSPHSPGCRRLLGVPEIDLVHFDLAQPWPAIDGPFDLIFHAGGRSEPRGCSIADYTKDNVTATQRLTDFAAAAGSPVVFCSSVSVYGEVVDAVVDEATAVRNPEPYGMTKRLAEMMLAERSPAFSSLSIRLPGVLGPGAETPWLAAVLRQARGNGEIRIYNPKVGFNNAVHVADLASWLASLAEHGLAGSDVVTLGARGRMNVEEVVRKVVDATGSKAKIREVCTDRRSFTISIDRACNRYGYRPMDIAEMAEIFVRENPS